MPISTLILDLDGTLYPNENGIWEAIANRMEAYMHQFLNIDPASISSLRQQYYQKFGTTLRGLQAYYHINPNHYLAYVHDIPIADYLKPDLELNRMLETLPQKKWIFTNSDRPHALRVLRALGIEHHFEDILDIIEMDYRNKPEPEVYKLALDFIGASSPEFCLFADDSPKNLLPAKELGMKTVLVGNKPSENNHLTRIPNIHHLPKVLKLI